jgi:hypothetical protein
VTYVPLSYTRNLILTLSLILYLSCLYFSLYLTIDDQHSILSPFDPPLLSPNLHTLLSFTAATTSLSVTQSSFSFHNSQKAPTMVALKFMRSHEQYMCEIRSRSCLAIQKDHVVGIIKHYGGGSGDLEVRYE